ncbi:MAG: DUF2283 domain-containing protein [Anaerolineae bacterium]|jgi:uncharacterized protein YuzE|nr:DUF2283 domain-containing protein [Anaerolineae bacterium]
MAEVKVWYDREGDFLEMIFEDAPATLEEVADDVFERRTPDGRVIGFAVFNFSKHNLETVSLPFAVVATSSVS